MAELELHSLELGAQCVEDIHRPPPPPRAKEPPSCRSVLRIPDPHDPACAGTPWNRWSAFRSQRSGAEHWELELLVEIGVAGAVLLR